MPKVEPAFSDVPLPASTLSEKQRAGRAINAVADLLTKRLLVPKIFLDNIFVEPKTKVYVKPRLAPGQQPIADLMAIDRAGSGDIHAVEVFFTQIGDKRFLDRAVPEKIQRILKFRPFHFFYFAVEPALAKSFSKLQLFAEDGIGRIGIIEIVENSSAPPEARVLIQAERFRVAPDWIKEFDRFQQKTPADMEFRD